MRKKSASEIGLVQVAHRRQQQTCQSFHTPPISYDNHGYIQWSCGARWGRLSGGSDAGRQSPTWYRGYILWVGRKQPGAPVKVPQFITPINYLVSM